MLRKFFWLFVIFPAGVVLVALALANRHVVRLSLDPFSGGDPFLAFDAPLFVYLLGFLLAGLLIGGALTWLKQGQWRRAARENIREADTLRAVNRRLDERLTTVTTERIGSTEAGE